MTKAPASRTLAACGAALTLGFVACGGMPAGVSSQISPEYRETVRAFYRGLASLEVGLLDDAQAAFERAAALAPDEPAIRANLAVVHVGFGNEAEAAGHIEAARGLAPDSAEVRFLEAQLAGFQGRFEDAVAGYRQVVELDPDHLRARYALAQELDRDGGDAEAAEAQAQLEAIRDRRPGNLAVLVQHARVAARRQDAPALTDTVERLQGMTGGWPDLAVTQLEGLSAAVAEADLDRARRPAQLLRNVLVRLPAFREDQARVSVSAEAIAEPLMRFLVLPSPPATASPRDESLAYVAGPLDPGASGDQTVVAVVPGGEEAPMVFAANAQEARRLGDPDGGAGLPFPAGPPGRRRRATACSPSTGTATTGWTSPWPDRGGSACGRGMRGGTASPRRPRRRPTPPRPIPPRPIPRARGRPLPPSSPPGASGPPTPRWTGTSTSSSLPPPARPRSCATTPTGRGGGRIRFPA